MSWPLLVLGALVLGALGGLLVAHLDGAVDLRTWPSKGFDNVFTARADGKLLETFDPAWHEVRRWLWWWTRGHKLGRGTVLMPRGRERHVVRVFVPPPTLQRKRFRGRRFSGRG
jgi:hypothetical protein